MRRIFILPFLALAPLSSSAVVPASAAAVSMQAQAAQAAEGYSNSAIYNSGFGMAPGQENRGPTGSNRDPNGNLLIVNGIMTGAGSFSQQEGLRQSGAGGPASASATAIGNNLQVNVTGAWNTVIVDSKQTNNADQTAAAALNGELKF
jgi:holdfast attachment protein HfaA